jgi:hypothetical protein
MRRSTGKPNVHDSTSLSTNQRQRASDFKTPHLQAVIRVLPPPNISPPPATNLTKRTAAMSSIPPPTLLTLPAEIRNSIYVYVFTEETPYDFIHKDGNTPSSALADSATHPHRLTLLATCRQTHHEASLLPWTLNTPSFSSFSVLISTLLSLTPAQRGAITSILFEIRKDRSPQIMGQLHGVEADGYGCLAQLLPRIREVRVPISLYSDPMWCERDFANVMIEEFDEQKMEAWLDGGGMRRLMCVLRRIGRRHPLLKIGEVRVDVHEHPDPLDSERDVANDTIHTFEESRLERWLEGGDGGVDVCFEVEW